MPELTHCKMIRSSSGVNIVELVVFIVKWSFGEEDCETRAELEQGTLATDAVLFIDTGTLRSAMQSKLIEIRK